MIAVEYNGVKLTDSYHIGNIRRPMPEFRMAATEIDGADGSSFAEQTVGPRRCSFEIVYSGAKTARALQDAARELFAVFLVREPAALKFSDERDSGNTQLVRYAVPNGTFDMEEFKKLGRWRVELTQPDPYLYGKKHSGVVIPANKTLKVAIGGNADTYLTAKATVASGASYAIRIVNGSKLEYAAAFSGQTVTVNMRTQTVRVSPAISGADGILTGSRFFAVAGTAKLLATHRTEISWRERWL